MLTRAVISGFSILVAMTSGAAPAFADAPADGAIVSVGADFLFTPVGFDDNDEVSVVVDGFLPNSCYRLVQPEVVVDPATKQVSITPKARYFDHLCIQSLVPYWQEIRLGMLPMGDYKVVVPSSGIQERMSVSEASNAGPDDFLYATIDSATVDRPADTPHYTIKLQGRFTNSCMVLNDIQVIDNGKTINVLPIMTMQDRDDCQPTEVPFRRMVNLPDSVTEGRHLLHVRSLNGLAINHVFSRD